MARLLPVSEHRAFRREKLRRFRLGGLYKVFSHRYRDSLPDDDAGREDLEILLRMSRQKNWRGAAKAWAPWLTKYERTRLEDKLLAIPDADRVLDHKQLGRTLRLTEAERTAARAWAIRPYDMTERQWQERGKMKDRQAKTAQRRNVGKLPREEYLTSFEGSLNKRKPWLALGIGRTKFFKMKREGKLANRVENHDREQGSSPDEENRRNRPSKSRTGFVPCKSKTVKTGHTLSAEDAAGTANVITFPKRKPSNGRTA